MGAFQIHQDLQGTALDRQESRPEEENLFHKDPGHQGQREGSHQAGTALAVGSLAALVAGAAGLVAHLDATALAEPVAHIKLTNELNSS